MAHLSRKRAFPRQVEHLLAHLTGLPGAVVPVNGTSVPKNAKNSADVPKFWTSAPPGRQTLSYVRLIRDFAEKFQTDKADLDFFVIGAESLDCFTQITGLGFFLEV